MTRDPRLVYALGNISLLSLSLYKSRFYILYHVYVNVKVKCKSIMQGQKERKYGGYQKNQAACEILPSADCRVLSKAFVAASAAATSLAAF